ncbi:hypothetical protein EV126DRAFT_2920 [Verticillium dahliae]|nr:hypothetical protein EV126DRAFT_2920 [Verticillium dahliae]
MQNRNQVRSSHGGRSQDHRAMAFTALPAFTLVFIGAACFFFGRREAGQVLACHLNRIDCCEGKHTSLLSGNRATSSPSRQANEYRELPWRYSRVQPKRVSRRHQAAHPPVAPRRQSLTNGRTNKRGTGSSPNKSRSSPPSTVLRVSLSGVKGGASSELWLAHRRSTPPCDVHAELIAVPHWFLRRSCECRSPGSACSFMHDPDTRSWIKRLDCRESLYGCASLRSDSLENCSLHSINQVTGDEWS